MLKKALPHGLDGKEGVDPMHPILQVPIATPADVIVHPRTNS